MCTPSDSNLGIYFQNIIPSISPSIPSNKILYATSAALPSFLQYQRIWNFVCNGRFTGATAEIIFDATQLVLKCPQYKISFEGKIYGQLTIEKTDVSVPTYMGYKYEADSNRISFRIKNPFPFANKTNDFYFNIFINDRNILA